jgi:hypothetical protein
VEARDGKALRVKLDGSTEELLEEEEKEDAS